MNLFKGSRSMQKNSQATKFTYYSRAISYKLRP